MSKKSKKTVFFSIFSIFLFVFCWDLFSFVSKNPVICSSKVIFEAIIGIVKNENFYKNMFSTMKILFEGIAISIFFGVFLGVAIDFSAIIKSILNPVIELFRNVPSISLFPIILVLFGIGDFSRVFIIIWNSIPAIILSTRFGLEQVDRSVIEASQMDSASNLDIVLKMKLPLAFLEILNGIKISIGSGFVSIVVAEMLGASKGLGFMLLWSTNSFKYNEAFAYIIIIAVLGFLFNFGMEKIKKIYKRRIL